MGEQQRVTQVFTEDRQPISVKLTRGAKGVYRWEIGAKTATLDRTLQLVKSADNWQREKYLEKQKMEVQTPSDPSDVSQDKTHARIDRALRNAREAGEKLVENQGGLK